MLQLEVLVSKLLAVDALTTSAVAFGEITALQHEVGNDTVECTIFESESFLASAQRSEIFRGLRYNILSKLKQFPKSIVSDKLTTNECSLYDAPSPWMFQIVKVCR